MMEYEDTETSSEISCSWKFELNSRYLLHSEHQVDRHQAISALSLCSQGYHYLLLAELGLLGQSCVCELNTSCNLNLLWDTYYRLLLLSSLFSSFPLPSLHFFFFFFRRWDREEDGHLFSRLSIIPLSVSPSGLIGVWETLVSSQWARPEQWRPI